MPTTLLSKPAPAPGLDDQGPPTPPADENPLAFDTNGDEELTVGTKVRDEDGDEGVVTEIVDGSSFVLVYFSASHCHGEFELAQGEPDEDHMKADYPDFQQMQQAEDTVYAYIKKLIDNGGDRHFALLSATNKFRLRPGQAEIIYEARRR